MAIVICPRCTCRNGKHRTSCGLCKWDLSRPYSLEIELANMENEDPKLAKAAAKINKLAIKMGLIKVDD